MSGITKEQRAWWERSSRYRSSKPDLTRAAITRWATVRLYSSAPQIQSGDYFSYHNTPDSLEWVVQTMLPPRIREQIGALIVQAYRDHHQEIATLLRPVIVQTIRDAADVIRDEFNKSVAGRQEQIEKLSNRYQVELVEKQLIPLIQDEIWPIVQQEATPLAMQIGEELWQQASIWRFGWRIVYDQSPLPQRNLVRKEFQRFLDRYGGPVIQAHLPDMLEVQRNVIRRMAENPKIRTVSSRIIEDVVRDQEFQQLVNDVLRDIFVDNERLSDALERNWNSEQARTALEITNDRLQSTITRIGQTLFGAPDTRITPEFSRVLRNRVLHKDDRWLELHLVGSRGGSQPEPGELHVVPGQTGTENPFHIPHRSSF